MEGIILKQSIKTYIDNTGVTENMSIEEKFEFLKNQGLIDKSEVIENWSYSSSEVDKDVVSTPKRFE